VVVVDVVVTLHTAYPVVVVDVVVTLHTAYPVVVVDVVVTLHMACSVAKWLACWTQSQKGPGSNRSRDAVG